MDRRHRRRRRGDLDRGAGVGRVQSGLDASRDGDRRGARRRCDARAVPRRDGRGPRAAPNRRHREHAGAGARGAIRSADQHRCDLRVARGRPGLRRRRVVVRVARQRHRCGGRGRSRLRCGDRAVDHRRRLGRTARLTARRHATGSARRRRDRGALADDDQPRPHRDDALRRGSQRRCPRAAPAAVLVPGVGPLPRSRGRAERGRAGGRHQLHPASGARR